MTTTAEAASNGSTTTTTTTADAPAEREHGLARLREEECYHLTTLVRDALNEAERLTNEVNGRSMDRYRDYSGSNGTGPLDRDYAVSRLNEARDCAQVAIDYLYKITTALRDLVEQPF